MRRSLLSGLGVLLICWSAAAGATEIELYRPRHRLPDELVGLAAGVLGPEGSAMVDPGSGALVLHGSRAALDQALKVLRSLDVALRSFQVEALATTRAELSRASLDVSGWVQLGDLRVGRLPAGGPGLWLSAGAEQRSSARRVQATLSVREGSSADLWTGHDVPAAIALPADSGDVRVVRALRPVRSGFRVRPRGLGDGSIELWIRAIVARDSLEMPIEETGAETHFAVRAGEWVALGSLLTSSGQQVSGTGLASQGGERREDVLLVRVGELAGSAQ